VYAEPWPGPPAMRKIVPRATPSAGTSSTWSPIVPGTAPVRSMGTATLVQTRPGALPQRSAEERCARSPITPPSRPTGVAATGCESARVSSVTGRAPADAAVASTPRAATSAATRTLLGVPPDLLVLRSLTAASTVAQETSEAPLPGPHSAFGRKPPYFVFAVA